MVKSPGEWPVKVAKAGTTSIRTLDTRRSPSFHSFRAVAPLRAFHSRGCTRMASHLAIYSCHSVGTARSVKLRTKEPTRSHMRGKLRGSPQSRYLTIHRHRFGP